MLKTVIAVAAFVAAVPACAQALSSCEIHVWPTKTYIAINTGLLSGLGPLGAVADAAAHKDKVVTVKDLMEQWLSPEQQLQILQAADVATALKLSGYKVVTEEALPSPDEAKADQTQKIKLDAMNARLKQGKRLSGSTSPCYAELMATHIFWQRAMMYGTRLFGGWVYRDFKERPTALKTVRGQVENSTSGFPPAEPAANDAAQNALRTAYAHDFSKFVALKIKP